MKIAVVQSMYSCDFFTTEMLESKTKAVKLKVFPRTCRMFKCVLLLAVQWIRNWFEFQDNFHDGAETHHDQPWGKAQRLWDWRDDQVIIWLIID